MQCDCEMNYCKVGHTAGDCKGKPYYKVTCMGHSENMCIECFSQIEEFDDCKVIGATK